MGWENIISLLGGGISVFVLELYTDWHKAKRGDTKDVIGAWQEIADREASRTERSEAHISLLEKNIFERDFYIKKLESTIINADLKLPEHEYTSEGVVN